MLENVTWIIGHILWNDISSGKWTGDFELVNSKVSVCQVH
jgi:hypothetical protein